LRVAGRLGKQQLVWRCKLQPELVPGPVGHDVRTTQRGELTFQSVRLSHSSLTGETNLAQTGQLAPHPLNLADQTDLNGDEERHKQD
jgi:hypothetical protein